MIYIHSHAPINQEEITLIQLKNILRSQLLIQEKKLNLCMSSQSAIKLFSAFSLLI